MGICSMEPWELDLQNQVDTYLEGGILDTIAEGTISGMFNIIKDNPVLGLQPSSDSSSE